MPKVNLRLTDEELEQLQAWAKDGRRSLQKEIVYRLFQERTEELSERVVKNLSGDPSGVVQSQAIVAQPLAPRTPLENSGAAGVEAAPSGDTRAQAPQSRVTAPESSFKPDFKPEKPERPKRTGFRKS